MKKLTAYDVAQIALLASMIAVTGSFKLPTGVPGAEFQLSAPLAVAIAAVFGFWRYITAGIIASFILMLLGIHNFINFEISMVFRLAAGGLVAILGPSLPVLLMAGPTGTAAARWVLALTLGIDAWPLLVAALPGMVYTMLLVWPLYKTLQRVKTIVEAQYGKHKHSHSI